MYWCHDACIFWDLDVVVFGSFRCSWDVGIVRVVLSVVSAVSRLSLGHCWSPLCSLSCVAFAFSMYMAVCPSSFFFFFLGWVSNPILPPPTVGPDILVSCPSI